MRNTMERTVDSVVPDLEDTLRHAAPRGEEPTRGRRTEPHLDESINAHLVGPLEYLFVGPDHSEFVLEGTRPHRIEGNPLAFEWHGEQVFFMHVNHPGTEPNDFVARALDIERPHIEGKAASAAAVTRRNNGA